MYSKNFCILEGLIFGILRAHFTLKLIRVFDYLFQTGSCKIIDDSECSSGSNAPVYDSSDLMANPNPKPPKPDLSKVLAYQQMQQKLKIYHNSLIDDQRASLKDDIQNIAVMNGFVSEFTSLVVVEPTRRKLPVNGVTIIKKRSKEKQEKLKQMFAQHREEVERLKAIEKVFKKF